MALGGMGVASLARGVTEDNALSGMPKVTKHGLWPAGSLRPNACSPFIIIAPGHRLARAPGAGGRMAPSPRLGGELAPGHHSSRRSPRRHR